MRLDACGDKDMASLLHAAKPGSRESSERSAFRELVGARQH